MNYNVTLNSKTKNKKKKLLSTKIIKIKWRRNLSVTCFGMVKFSEFHVW